MITRELFEAICQMETTVEIAKAFDAVLEVIGNADGSIELVAAVILAQIHSGKGTIHMKTND